MVRRKCYYQTEVAYECAEGSVCIESLLYTVVDSDDEPLYYVYDAMECGHGPTIVESIEPLSNPESCGENPCSCYLMPLESEPIPLPSMLPLQNTPSKEEEAWALVNGRRHKIFKKQSNSNNAILFEHGIPEYGKYLGNNGQDNKYYVVEVDSKKIQLVWMNGAGFGYEISPNAIPDNPAKNVRDKKIKYKGTEYLYGLTMKVKFGPGDNRHFVVVLKGN